MALRCRSVVTYVHCSSGVRFCLFGVVTFREAWVIESASGQVGQVLKRIAYFSQMAGLFLTKDGRLTTRMLGSGWLSLSGGLN